MKKVGALLTLGMTLSAQIAIAQDKPTLLNGYPSFEVITADSVDKKNAVTWEPFKTDAPADEVKAQLERAGWDTGTVLEKLQGGTKFDLYQKAIGPGEIGYMAVPKAGSSAATPSTFLPFDSSPVILAAGGSAAPASFTANQIRSELVRGIETGLDTFCSLKAKPTTVTMTVSAFGVVDVEAIWNTNEVCPGMQQQQEQ